MAKAITISKLTHYHVCATKDWMKEKVRRYGPNWIGLPDTTPLDEALALIDAVVTEYVTNVDCDHRDEDGRCLGHELSIEFERPETSPQVPLFSDEGEGDGHG